MKKLILTTLAVMFIFSLQAQTNNIMNYAQSWEKVTKLEQQSLPKSAAEEVNKILRQAIADKNSPQVIKALIHRGKYDMTIDTENDTAIFHNLTDMLAKSRDTVEKSVLHSMLGELYLQYYRKDAWSIDQRTALGSFVPEDMKEWSKNNFLDKVVEHLNASIASQAELQKAQVEPYAAVVELGKDSRLFYPSMYDFLTLRAIEFLSQLSENSDLSRSLAKKNIAQQSLFAAATDFVKLNFDPQPEEYNLWALETYKKLLSSLQQRNLNKSALLTELNKMDYLARTLHSAYRTHAFSSLQTLLRKWEGKAFSVEIVDKTGDFYLQNIGILPQTELAARESKTKEYYDLLQKTVRDFPKYERISAIENRLSQLTQPQFSTSGNSTFAPNGEKKITVTYKNIGRLTAKLYKLSSPLPYATKTYGGFTSKNEQKTFVKDIACSLPDKAPYTEGKAELKIYANEYGTYKLEFDYPGKEKADEYRQDDYYFAVSDLAVFSRSSAKNKYEFFVVNRETGKPIPQTHINIYKLPAGWHNSVLTLAETITTNSLGLAVYNKNIPNNDVFYQAVSGGDNGAIFSKLPYSNYEYSNKTAGEELRESVNIFSDRSLYRPGQTIFFKAIATTTQDRNPQIAVNKSLEFILRDANSQEIAKQILKTNEFGSASGEFVLPQGLLNGHFSITTQNGYLPFRVEEYKRPTFEVLFDKIEKTYKFGEEIMLSGKAENYSGMKLQNANVSYSITRQQSWWWRWGGGVSEHFAEGVAVTDENGQFCIRFTPEKNEANSPNKMIYSFDVEATITDANGETQTGNYAVAVGDISMMLNIEMPEKWERSSTDKLQIAAKNLDGNDIKASGTYQVFSLHENNSINKQLLQGDFETGEEQTKLKSELQALPSGKYRLKLQSKDDRANEITAQTNFTLFAYSDKHPPVKTNEWFVEKSNTFSDTRPAEIILGATDKINVLYELWQEQTLLERKWITIDKQNHLFTIPRKTEYKNGVNLMLSYVKDEKFYLQSVSLTPEKGETGLSVKLDVFRDKIRPGANEEWRLSVKDAKGNTAAAEVLAGMYDFSLDQIYPAPKWLPALPQFRHYKISPIPQQDYSFNPHRSVGFIHSPMKDVVSFRFDRFNWFDFSFFHYGGMMTRSMKTAGEVLGNYMAEEEIEITCRDPNSPLPPPKAKEEEMYALSENIVVQDAGAKEKTPATQIRRNFSETAFFFPQLRTNDKGETQLSFTVPESNTRWRFRVLAHDKNLNTGQAEAFVTSQKELMITPNMPRFLRHGDVSTISTKISNLSDTVISGNVKLEFINPVTEEVLSTIALEHQSQPFSVTKGESANVSWTFDVPGNVDVIGVRIIADGGGFSDGEQHALAVLPNRMLVTETLRMDVNGTQTREFTMEKLAKKSSKTIEDYRLTIEFTSNPAWYAVQALPVLSNPESDNAVSWFAAYYANTLGTHIGKAYPKVSAMIEAWRKQGGSSVTLLSNLEKNQELKNVLLEETPWVLEAKNESEQKQKLALLFDLNRSQNLTRQAINKLKELQTTQGGWSWFKGFHPSRSITQYILYGFNQLNELKATEFPADVRAMQEPAVYYMDGEALRSFENLKKNNKDWRKIESISTSDLEYLCVRTHYPQYPLSKSEQEMTDFYTSVVEKNWTKFGLYERSLIAILMQKNGKQNIAQDILKSYREHATVSEEMGMFWANNRANVFMSQSTISLHTFIMNAFLANGATPEEMDGMKRWLLKQKQTQLWESTHATMDAVYALLSSGSDWFAGENSSEVTIADKVIKPKKQELGTGYFKEAWHKSEITPEMGHVKIKNSGNAPAWGALYWQYYEDLDRISKTDASLDVEKLLFVEKTNTSGTKLIPITENNPIEVGDKVIVRLTVRTDRDLEFVHLKDMRAAAFEPAEQLSGVEQQGGTIYYQISKDASTNFYFNVLPRGTYVLEYSVFASRAGDYSNGITTIECMYAPEFRSHTAGARIRVEE